MAESAPLEIAASFFAAIERADLETVRALYADDVVIWHAHTGKEQTREENLALLAQAVKSIQGFRYEEVRRLAIADGFVEQHVLRGTAPSGQPLEVPACIVVRLRNGRIARLDEYLDSKSLAPLFAHPGA
jgi:ketosteroid isomerase-like protein